MEAVVWIVLVFAAALVVNVVSGEYKQGPEKLFCRRCGRSRRFPMVTVSHNPYDRGVVSGALSNLLEAEIGHNTRERRCEKCWARP